MNKVKVAFVCVHNSCRSQMAEALGKKLAGNVFESYSAGTETKPNINQGAVRSRDYEEESMSELSKLPNVGNVLEQNLLAVGIETPEQLGQVGAKEAFLRIRMQQDPGACLHMLYGLQGAIEGVPDKFLADITKQDLKTFYNSL